MSAGVPTYDELFNPVLKSMNQLGGSATVQEIENKVIENLDLNDDAVNEIHRGNTTKLSYRLAWSRNYLKRVGLLENSSRGVWTLTTEGIGIEKVDKEEVKRKVKSTSKLKTETDNEEEMLESDADASNTWKAELLNTLQEMAPDSFERLCQRILRESGFVEVKVTGRSGDGGIDGHGVIKLNHIINFPILFQCKRYKGSVSSKEIRDFRGAMAGRTEMGIFITTGNFTRDAQNEAARDGVATINLIDGEGLVDLMKNLGLGVKVETVEQVEIVDKWFEDFK